MQAELVELSFELAAERCEDLTPLVYARLFRENPEMEALFWRDSNNQVKGEMLSRVVRAILDFVGERLYAATLIQCEVITHEGYDVPPKVFGLFFGTVRDTLRELLAADWSAEMDAAWDKTLTELDFYVTHPDQAETTAPAKVA
ncbi:globin [Phenylobacterium aquaticum]|uniref:globin n=1 Tax=Phenylobacterium aquaticum TaxID=1763816 RepID=UPI001F5C363B|nr:globin [Phenylobacterium aquaticum]MCI3134901.1 globin [Phenylobacterium aquaticum]